MKVLGILEVSDKVAQWVKWGTLVGAVGLVPLSFWAFDAQGLWVILPELLLLQWGDLHKQSKDA